MRKILMTAGVVALALTTSASASPLFSIVGGQLDAVPAGSEGLQDATGRNDVLENLGIGDIVTSDAGTPGDTSDDFDYRSLDVYQGGDIKLLKNTRLKVEVLGWEAGFNNSFDIDGQSYGRGLNGLSTAGKSFGNPLATYMTGPLSADTAVSFLDFSFTSINKGNNAGGVDNGSNTFTGQNFAATYSGGLKRDGHVLWLFYDDGGINKDNHDDLVVRLSAVPLPAGMVLMLTGLGALVMRRKFS